MFYSQEVLLLFFVSLFIILGCIHLYSVSVLSMLVSDLLHMVLL